LFVLCARDGTPFVSLPRAGLFYYCKVIRPRPSSVLIMLLPFDRRSCLRVRLSSVGCADLSGKEEMRLQGPEGREVLVFCFDVSRIDILPPSCSVLNGLSSDSLAILLPSRDTIAPFWLFSSLYFITIRPRVPPRCRGHRSCIRKEERRPMSMRL
jgi:hypothetical protein